jgi:diadenylate cyclase
MSENSDAVVVIVSEETGTIPVAVGGMLKRHLAPQTLERLLRNELCPKVEERETGLATKLRQKLNKKNKFNKNSLKNNKNKLIKNNFIIL